MGAESVFFASDMHARWRSAFVARIRIVDDETSCWDWTGAMRHGYGRVRRNRRSIGAHRIALEMATGVPIPEGAFVLHSCDRRSCVRPSHLRVGSPLENMQDMWSRGRGRPRASIGEKHPRAKIPDAEVANIRALSAAGVTQLEIARRYGVHGSQINRIVHGRARKHAPIIGGSPRKIAVGLASKIEDAARENPSISHRELASLLGVSSRALSTAKSRLRALGRVSIPRWQ